MKRVAVIGGGVIGLTAAYALRRDGHEVVVLEAGNPGQGASKVNAGWICPSLSDPVPSPGLMATSIKWMLKSDSPLYIKPSLDPEFLKWTAQFWRHCTQKAFDAGLAATARLNARTLELYDQLEADGVRFQHYKDGLLFAYISPTALEADLKAMEPLRQFGIDVPTAVWGKDVRDLEPGLSDSINGGFLYPLERHVRPDTLTGGLVEWLAERMVEVRGNAAITGFDHVNGQVNAVMIGNERIETDAVVLATGAYTGKVAAMLGVKLPFQGGKGYSLDFSPPPLTLKRSVYLHEARVAITPMGQWLRLAGTMEFSGFNDTIRRERVNAIAERAGTGLRGWAPDPAKATIGTGLRPMTPDGLPAIGWLPGFRNAAVAAGHGMLGMTLAPSTAEGIATLLRTGTLGAEFAPFDPKRFV